MRETITHHLESAYRATDYRVDGPVGPFVIRIGEVCDAIPADSWAYITACNPRSRRLPDNENTRRMQMLRAEVESAGYRYWRGHSEAQDHSWPPEPSLLVFDISRNQAAQLGRQFDQWAIVFGLRGQPAELVWIQNVESVTPE